MVLPVPPTPVVITSTGLPFNVMLMVEFAGNEEMLTVTVVPAGLCLGLPLPCREVWGRKSPFFLVS